MELSWARPRWRPRNPRAAVDVASPSSPAYAAPNRRYRARTADQDRTRDVAHLLIDLRAWASDHPDIRAVAITGSWAHGTAHMDSDVDILVLAHDPAGYTNERNWADALGELTFLRLENRRDMTEVRFCLLDGLELEFAFARTSWATVVPVNPDAAHIVNDGISVLYDPDRLLARLQRAVSLARRSD